MNEYRDRAERELKNTTRRMSRLERKQSIINATLRAAEEYGLNKFTVAQIADYSECKPSTVKYYFGGITNLRTMVKEYGNENNIEWITSQLQTSDRICTIL